MSYNVMTKFRYVVLIKNQYLDTKNILSINIEYNITNIYNFRGTDILPKYLEKKRFMVYGVQAFGLPLIVMLIVVSYDRAEYKRTQEEGQEMVGNETSERYDPGFGEESCWFSSCSKSLSLFLYG